MTTALNDLVLRQAPEASPRGEPALEIWIDGVRLLDAVTAAELGSIARGARRNAVGGYGSLPLSDHGALLSAGRRYLLGCDGCGEPGCWPLLVNVTISGGVVVWSDFRNPHMTDWDYRDLGPFRFDEAQYREAWLAALDLGD